MTAKVVPPWLSRVRSVLAHHQGALDLVVLGALTLFALRCLCHLAETHTPIMSLAVGPDQDDWWGVFRGVEQGWPFRWDEEWSIRSPLVPVLAYAVARAVDAPMALASQMITIVLGSLVPGMTWILGRRAVGRPAALAASVWILGQPLIASAAITTTAYSYVTPLYMFLLLGIVGTYQERRGSRALLFVASLLVTALLLQGVLLVLYTAGAAVVAALLLPRAQRPGLKVLTRRTLPGLLGAGSSMGLMALLFPHVDSPLADLSRRVHHDIALDPASHSVALVTDILPPSAGVGIAPRQDLAEPALLDRLVESVEAFFALPAVPAVVGLALGVVLLVALRRRPHLFSRLLLASCFPPLALAIVLGNNIDHLLQWFPVVGLAVMLGLVRPLGVLPWIGLPAQWLVSLTLITWLADDIQGKVYEVQDPPSTPFLVETYYKEMQRNTRLCRQSFAPISEGGTLFTDSLELFVLRGAMRGRSRGQVVNISGLAGEQAQGNHLLDLSRYQRPWFIATNRKPQDFAGLFPAGPTFSRGVRLDGGMPVGEHPFLLYRYAVDVKEPKPSKAGR